MEVRLESIIIECPKCETTIVLPQQVNNECVNNNHQSIFIGQRISSTNGSHTVEKEYKETKEEPLFIRRQIVDAPLSSSQNQNNLIAFIVMAEFLAICVCISLFS